MKVLNDYLYIKKEWGYLFVKIIRMNIFLLLDKEFLMKMEMD